MPELLCFGLGYSAAATARRFAESGFAVSGTSRTRTGAAAIEASGAMGYVFDGALRSAEVTSAVSRATHLLISIPPGSDGDPVLRHYAADVAAPNEIGWIAYLSTIGVYGDRGGEWVDEDTEARPDSERSRRRLEAERHWLELGRRAGKPVTIFRLSGVYGPGRSAVDQLRAGTARRIVKPGQVFNRIHVAEIANVLLAWALAPSSPSHRVYNLTDDEPAPPQDVVAYAARLLGVQPPPEVPFADADLSEMGRSFYAENKRVRNHRVKAELVTKLLYPTYREGLSAIVAQDS